MTSVKSNHSLDETLSPYLRLLPVGAVAGEVNRLLRTHSRLVLTAPPGAGKSTLLPLTILQEQVEGKILMLEPRRLAARQVAERMAVMLGEPVGQTVGYRVRFETRVSATTRVEVLTEGILGRMLVDDPTLEGVSVVIFDEFHERSLQSDTAFALTCESQQLVRPDLRMVVMSATIDTSFLCQTWDAPLVQSEGRRFPVAIHYEEETDAIHCAARVASAVRKAHRLHQGDILAFLPGQAEIMQCCELLADALGDTVVCPLYGMMSPQAQRRAILPSAEGERKVVLATPVAETSITIEGVKVVVDSGLYRKMVYDPRNGLSRLETVRIAADMAAQRSGRAGRVSEGICYRLWSKATELRMAACRQPEILDAELASTLLDVTAWGETDLYRLPWLTPPPRAHVAEARRLLTLLGALDAEGRITSHGRRLASLPCHPRIAQMLVKAETDALKAVAADVAAVLEEKDVVEDAHDADLHTRLVLLREARRRNRAGRWGRIMQVARQYARMVGVKEDNTLPNPYDVGRLIASAYPERIALAEADGLYKMANGERVRLDMEDDLVGCPLLAVASVGLRIFLAAPLAESALQGRAEWLRFIHWDSRQGRVVAQEELRVGALVMDTRPIAGDIHDDVVQAVCEAAPKEGATMFDFSDEVLRLQQRIQTVASWHPDLLLPDVSLQAVLERVDEWLPLFIGSATTVAELRKINLCEVVWGLLDYEQQVAVERIAPTHVQVPSGSRIRLDYRQGSGVPVLSVRLQECFGMTDTPRIDEGRRPVLMELLSPGFKPVQLTQDLPGFWRDTYFEVRKELRRRYPKHSWPDNPLEAPATRGVVRRGNSGVQ